MRDVECEAAWEQVDLVFQKAVSSLEGNCSCQPSESWVATSGSMGPDRPDMFLTFCFACFLLYHYVALSGLELSV